MEELSNDGTIEDIQSGVIRRKSSWIESTETDDMQGTHKPEFNCQENIVTDSQDKPEDEPRKESSGKLCKFSWSVVHYNHLPKWLQDNDFILNGHRPPLPNIYECVKSIFRLHTETINIWSHLLGCMFFIALSVDSLIRGLSALPIEEKVVFGTFFVSAILCLGISSVFHMLCCHSEYVGKLFSKLDYCGIAFLIMGSHVPWLYYGFYCHFQLKILYACLVTCLGIMSIIVSLWDRFSEPKYRTARAAVFVGFGLSGVVPAVHMAIQQGIMYAISEASLGWLILMGSLYILGAFFYAARLPERLFPGRCDIWFQSHQIFHILVVAAAYVHYQGITKMALARLTIRQCLEASKTEDQF